jgi:hypothetical protein
MLVDATQSTAATGVTGAIQKAAKLTGTSFQYLMATAKVESNLNPRAAAQTSSAGGLFQFIEQTWLGTLKQAGPELGYGRYADAISRNSAGRYTVSDPAMRAEIMKLRQDPTANAVMAGALTKSNAAMLSAKLGRAPSEGELYIAHFLGASGAARLIGAAEQNPSANAAGMFPNAARANRSIFFDKDGRARNFAQVSQALAGRYQSAVVSTAPLTATASVTPQVAAESARVARAYEIASPAAVIAALPPAPAAVAAQTVPAATQTAAAATPDEMFRNPYRIAETRQPRTTAASDMWAQAAANAARMRGLTGVGTAPAKPASRTQAAQAPQPVQNAQEPARTDTRRIVTAQASAAANEPLGLFQDFKPNVRALFGG